MKLSELDLLKVGHTIQMAGAVYIGEGKMFVCLFPEEHGVISTDRPIPVTFTPSDGSAEMEVHSLEMDSEDWKAFIRQTDLLETEILEKASDGTLAKVIIRKSNRQIDQTVSWNVFRRDNYSCRYCGKNDVPLTVDHVICYEDRGPAIEENLTAACRKCNKTRGNLSYAEWLKHPHYLHVSKGLSPETRAANEALLGTLDKIPLLSRVKAR